MGNRVVKFGVVVGAVLAVGACSGAWEEDGLGGIETKAPASMQVSRAPTPADEIQLFTGSSAARSFTVIQDIEVAVNKTTAFHPNPTVAGVEARLRASAAKLGGDAVINVVISDVKIRAFSWGGRTGSGTVVKY
ncbi:hypothetical protein [Celeribacter arenosi]|uniref:Heavy-metal-binding n=1 Tax=Celeribacter arenosi TaxID=792649 RepID=A0ABP7KD14_9RHOB